MEVVLKKAIKFFHAPVFPDDDEKTRRARALNALQLNLGFAILVLGGIGLLFFFAEKAVTSIVLLSGLLVAVSSLILNHRGWVDASGMVVLVFLWFITVALAVFSKGIQSLHIIFFISGTVVAGIVLGAKGAYSYAGLSLLTGLGLILLGNAGFEFPNLFSYPPVAAWIILFINLIFTVVPLQVALESLSESASRAHASEERYRLIASVMSDYAFSIQYGKDGEIDDQWLSGAFEAITGYTPNEYFDGGGWLFILHPDDREQDAQDMAQLRANQKVISDVRIIRKDGNIRWVRTYGHPKWDETNNRLAGIYGAVQDITGRKHVEVELQRRAEEVSLLYRLGAALSSGENLYQALRAFVGELKQVMALDAFHVGIYDEETDVFSYSLFLNLDKDILPPPRKLKESPGLTWEVISTRKTLYLQDVAAPQIQHAHNIVWVVDAPIRSYLGIPLLLKDRVIGIMSAQSLRPDAYTPTQIRLLETIAAQVSITIEKMSLLEQVQQELAERKKTEAELQQREAILEVVASAANTFLKISKWDADTWRTEVDKLLERLGVTIKASHAYIFENHLGENGTLLMSMQNEWTGPGFKSDLDNSKYRELSIDEFYMENWNESILRGDPYVGDHIHASQRDMDDLKARGIYALLDVPIYVDDVWWGLIGFDDMAGLHEWSNAEVDAIIVAANLLGAVIKRRKMDSTLQGELEQRKTLIVELKKRNAESETLRESAAIVAGSLEKGETLSLILEQIARVVPYQSASVQLIVGHMLEIVSSRGVDFINQDIGTFFPINEDEPAYLVIKGQLPYILYNDVQTEVPSFNAIPHDNIRAWMAVPLKVKGRVLGIIAMDGDRVGQFSERDAELAVTYANQVAVALENSRLFTELQAELSLKQNLITELENKNAELERFTYTVSHDLRSPLVTIRGFLGYLEEDAKEGNMERFRKDLDRISRATIRMDNLLKDLLELSRIGRLINQPQDIPFGDLVKEALEIVHGRLEERDIALRIHPNLPLVHGDKPRLTEVLQNLIDNAAKYMGDQKNPVIEIGMEGVDASNLPVFFVRDNGMGIASEYHERIFRLFDKLDAMSEGTGVGLALVKRIIEFHGGRIWVQSEPGNGSTFYFTLSIPGA